MTASVSKPDKPSLREQQYLFTRHMRDPEGAPAPANVEERRLAIYRDLLYRNVEKFMASSYPVIRRIIPDEQWHALIRDYFRDHQARTPLFPRMPQEFLHYLEGLEELPEGYPFLLELAHYEWVELAVSLDTREIDFSEIDTQGDLLEGIPVLSPLVMPLAYRYPVHRIRPDNLPDQPPETPTYLLVYRDRHDQVGFLELNPVSARLVEQLQKRSGETGRQILEAIAGELQHPNPDVVIQGGLEILQMMREKDIVPGTLKKQALSNSPDPA